MMVEAVPDKILGQGCMPAGRSLAVRPWALLGEQGEGADVEWFAVLPHRRAPRWVVPVSGRVNSRVGLELYAPAKLLGKARKLFLQLRLLWPGLFLRDELVAIRRDGARQLWGQVFTATGMPHDVQLFISVGTAGPTQKITALLVDREGQRRAILKLPVEPLAGERVLHEARMLRFMAGRVGGAVVPRLLGEFQTTFGRVVVQSLVPTRGVGNRLTARHWQLLSSLLTQERTSISAFIANGGLVDRLGRVKSGLEWSPRDLAPVQAALTRLAGDGRPVQSCIVHGDFAPWNIGLGSDGEALSLFDWEYGIESGLPVLDVVHFLLRTGVLVDDLRADALLDRVVEAMSSSMAADYLVRAGLDVSRLGDYVLLYLLLQIAQEGEQQQGRSREMEDLLQWLVLACRRWGVHA